MKLAALFLILVLFGGCASKSDEYTTVNEQINEMVKKGNKNNLLTDFNGIPRFSNQRNKVAPGFQFYLFHPSDEKLKGKFRADFNGDLNLPYDVIINVKDLTFDELKDKVLKRYSKFFQKGVESVEFKILKQEYFVEVRGFVKKSGKYLVNRNEGIDKVIDRAGGLRGDLQKNFYKASINQRGRNYSISLNQYYQNSKYTNAFRWTGGDKIFVTELDESEMGGGLPIITVLAGVKNPGKILYKPNAHLFYYLGKSGGTIDDLDYRESYIIRTTAEGIQRIQFELTDMETVPALAPNDIILLQAQKMTLTDRVWERVVQISTILTSIALIIAL